MLKQISNNEEVIEIPVEIETKQEQKYPSPKKRNTPRKVENIRVHVPQRGCRK